MKSEARVRNDLSSLFNYGQSIQHTAEATAKAFRGLCGNVRRCNSTAVGRRDDIHRLQLIRGGNALIIDDAYNSNPSGAKAAVETLKAFDAYRILLGCGG